MACLDTTFLLDLLGRGGRRAERPARLALANLVARGEALCTTRLNVAELWTGVFRSREAARERARVERLLAELVVLDFDAPAAEAFGRITADLQRRGRPAGDMDVLIAAVALAHGQRLVTRNAGHFRDIAGLVVEGY